MGNRLCIRKAAQLVDQDAVKFSLVRIPAVQGTSARSRSPIAKSEHIIKLVKTPASRTLRVGNSIPRYQTNTSVIVVHAYVYLYRISMGSLTQGEGLPFWAGETCVLITLYKPRCDWNPTTAQDLACEVTSAIWPELTSGARDTVLIGPRTVRQGYCGLN